MEKPQLKPIERFKPLDGYHCITNSLAKIFDFYGHPLSEEMLLGLGAGMGFIYWHQKGTLPFLGGRDNLKNFYQDLTVRSGVLIEQHITSSPVKAEKELLAMLGHGQPVMVYGDMAYLPCFDFGGDYHFGGHSFVICGYDGAETVLASEMEPEVGGLKKGFVYEMSLAQLTKARNSKFKPFPPQNAYCSFDFSQYRNPGTDEVRAAIAQVADRMLHPPITNVGVKGIRKSGTEMLKWPKLFSVEELKLALFNIYIFIHIGGTGSGLFRYMYSRFLEEAAGITGAGELVRAAEMIKKSGDLWTDLAMGLKNALEVENPGDLVAELPERLKGIADLETETFEFLSEVVG